jgi:hypothetical protein
VKLITAHRILIAAGIAFFLFYALFQARLFVAHAGGIAAIVQAAISAAIVIGLIVYYRSLKRWGER